MLADAMCEEIDQPMKYEYDRHSKREKRTKNEIGIHAVRGGTIVGEHEIIFAGRDEIITLSHSARSKEICSRRCKCSCLYERQGCRPLRYERIN